MMTLWLLAAGSLWEAVGGSSGQESFCILYEEYLRFCVHSTPTSNCVLAGMSFCIQVYIYIYSTDILEVFHGSGFSKNKFSERVFAFFFR